MVLAAAPLLLAVGCGGGEPGGNGPGSNGAGSNRGEKSGPVSITVRPDNDKTSVRPDAEVTVSVKGGRLASVAAVADDGVKLRGKLDRDAARWTSLDRLAFDTTYTVTASATGGDGTKTSVKSTFSTLDPPASKQLKATTIAPLDGWTVGVAQPLVVGFNHPVEDREAVQAALRVETTRAVNGAWYWIDDQYVHYRPQRFWPGGIKVTLHADIAGVDAGDGMWGAANRTRSFKIARTQVIRVNVKEHRLALERGGRIVRSFPVSTGKRGWETRNGIKVIIEKVRHKKWTNDAIQAPEDYTLFSDYAMRMTNSGEFIHDAPWNTGNIGSANTSHGCVGLRPKDMAWLYGQIVVGDPVIVTGSPRKYTELWNRYMDWNVPWPQWSAGNA